MSRRPRLAISLGDPCGIGPELLLRCAPQLAAACDLLVVGAKAGVDLLAECPGAPVAWHWGDPEGGNRQGSEWVLHVEAPGATSATRAAVRWLDPTPDLTPASLHLGQGSAASGEATVRAIQVAARRVLEGQADALVTLPMSKAAAHLAGHNLPGHTEFLASLAQAPAVRMAFLSPRLNVVLHTVHQSLRSVVQGLQAEAVAETLVFTATHLSPLLGLPGLRVALCALNPHAGEQGAFGEEEGLLVEALDRARAAFVPGASPLHPTFTGPHPSDSLFLEAVRGSCDVVVALYHDQGLIPIKVLEPDRAVNVTLGLPFVRTSPDHGTAFDKAGKWAARPANFLAAAALALQLAGRSSAHP